MIIKIAHLWLMLHCVLTGSCKLIVYVPDAGGEEIAVTHMYTHTGIMQCMSTRATWSYTFSHSYIPHDLLNPYHTIFCKSAPPCGDRSTIAPTWTHYVLKPCSCGFVYVVLSTLLGCQLLAAPSMCQAYSYNLQRTCDPLMILLLLLHSKRKNGQRGEDRQKS